MPELMVVAGVVLLLFGGRKLPELAQGLGEGIRAFRTAQHGEAPVAPRLTDPTDPNVVSAVTNVSMEGVRPEGVSL